MENPAADKVTLFVCVGIGNIPMFSLLVDGGHNGFVSGNGLVVLVTESTVADEDWITDVFGLAGFLGRGGAADGENSLLFEVFLKSERFERRDIAFGLRPPPCGKG